MIGRLLTNVAAIKCGVPQESILVPLLFNIYIGPNDVVNISNILNMMLFADDTNIFISGNNITDICNTLNTELNKLVRWFKLNKKIINKFEII